jgi:hypothetical protein
MTPSNIKSQIENHTPQGEELNEMSIGNLKELKDALITIQDKDLELLGFGVGEDMEEVGLCVYEDNFQEIWAELEKKYPQVDVINKWMTNILKAQRYIESEDDNKVEEVSSMDAPISSNTDIFDEDNKSSSIQSNQNIKSQIEEEIKELVLITRRNNLEENRFFQIQRDIGRLKAKLEGIKIGEQKVQALFEREIEYEKIQIENCSVRRKVGECNACKIKEEAIIPKLKELLEQIKKEFQIKEEEGEK